MKRPSFAVEMALQVAGQQNVITIPRLFVKLMDGDMAAAAVLSQSLYWWDKVGRREFYKVDDEWEQEIGVSAKQMQRIRSKLEPFGVNSERKGVPAKMHYKVDAAKLENKLRRLVETVPAQREKQDSTVSENYIQETTSIDYALDYARETSSPTGDDLATLPKTHPKHTPPPEYADLYGVWNNHRGALPESINNDGVNKLLKTAVKKYDRTDLMALIEQGAQEVAADSYWLEKKYGFLNLLRNLDSKAEAYRARGGVTSGSEKVYQRREQFRNFMGASSD